MPVDSYVSMNGNRSNLHGVDMSGRLHTPLVLIRNQQVRGPLLQKVLDVHHRLIVRSVEARPVRPG